MSSALTLALIVLVLPSSHPPSSEPGLPTQAPQPIVVDLVALQEDRPEPGAATGGPARMPNRRPGAAGPRSRDEEVGRALLEGLRWLIRHQNPEGSWSAVRLADRCDADTPCHDPKENYHALYDEGVTALALLAFLETGYNPTSKQTIVDSVRGKRHDVRAALGSGLRWLAERQSADGHVTQEKAFLYNEALAALAFVEAFARTQDAGWKEHAQRSVDFLQAAQRPRPDGTGLWGWRYQARSEVEGPRPAPAGSGNKELFDADTSVTSWCAHALGAAREAGLEVRQDALDGALAFARFVTASDGRVGYIDPRGAGATVTGKNDHFQYHPAVMSALGMSTRLDLARDLREPFLELAARQLVSDLPRVSEDGLSVDYYYWHAGTRALGSYSPPGTPDRDTPGAHWRPWSEAVRGGLLARQDRESESCRRGGWIQLDRWAYTAGPVYTTAINVLTLAQLLEHRDPWWRDPTPRATSGQRAPPLSFTRGRTGARFDTEFRGRVVLLDFWSPWQQGYVEGVAARAELVRSLRGRPFALAGIGYLAREGDEPYLDRVDEGFGTWDSMLVEELEHRALADFDVRAFPTLIVIDAEGVIRMRDGTWEETTAFVERLVRETK